MKEAFSVSFSLCSSMIGLTLHSSQSVYTTIKIKSVNCCYTDKWNLNSACFGYINAKKILRVQVWACINCKILREWGKKTWKYFKQCKFIEMLPISPKYWHISDNSLTFFLQVVGSVLYFTNFCLDKLGQPILNENPQLTEGWEIPKYPVC